MLRLGWASFLSGLFRPPTGRREGPDRDWLARYDFSTEAAPPSAPVTDRPRAEGPTLVESGAFRVDREKAVEKLAGFQLPDPTRFLLPWLRCASASGATSLEIHWMGHGLEMRFDGRPLPRRVVQDPVSALFDEEGEDSERGRHLAAGLLAALRLSPRSLSIISGKGADRMRTDIELRWRPGASRTPAAGDDTVLSVELPKGDAHVALDAVRQGFWRSRMELRVGGRPVPDLPSTDLPSHSFTRGSLNGLLMLPEPGERAGDVRLFQHGALVSRSEARQGMMRVHAWLNDDEFRLDLSQSSVVRDARYERAMDALSEESQEFLKELGRRHKATWPGLCRSLAGGVPARLVWRLFTGGRLPGFLPALGVPGEAGVRRLAEWDLRVTRSLREALMLRGSFRAADWSHPLWRELVDVPVFVMTDGRLASCKSVDDWQGSRRHVPVYTGLRLGRGRPLAVWCPRPEDRECLETLFPPGT